MAPASSNKSFKQGNLFSFFGKKQLVTLAVSQKSSLNGKVHAEEQHKSTHTTTVSNSSDRGNKKKSCTTDSSLTSSSSPQQKNASNTKSSVSSSVVLSKGCRIEVYWPGDNEWYPAIISDSIINKSNNHRYHLNYDDGESEWIDLSKERFRYPKTVTTISTATSAVDDNEIVTPPVAKRRRVQIQENDDDEDKHFQFDDDISSNAGADDDDGSVYRDDDVTNNCDDDDVDLIGNDDNDSNCSGIITPVGKKKRTTIGNSNNNKQKAPALSMKNVNISSRKSNTSDGRNKMKSVVSLSQFQADKVTITEYKDNNSPKHVTPNSADSKTPHPSSSSSPHTVPFISSLNSPIKENHVMISSATAPTTTSIPPMFIMNEVNMAGSHVHNHLKFLRCPKDLMGRPCGHPEYDPRTLYVDHNEWTKLTGKAMTDAVRQWWEIKSQYYDTVLLFKTGKFYEMFHMDADIGVSVCGFNYMRGHVAHSGFPEIGYGQFASKLVQAGYKVARVEQTETPQQLAERKKKHNSRGGGGGVPKVVNREVCSVMTIGTRTFCYLDKPDYAANNNKEDKSEIDPTDTGVGPLLAIREILLDLPPGPPTATNSNIDANGDNDGKGQDDNNNDNDDDDDDDSKVQAVCEYGVTIVDTVRGSITVGQFADDVLRSRMLTLLTTFLPAEILIQGKEEDGSGGASETLLSLLKSFHTASPRVNAHVETICVKASFPKSTALDSTIRKLIDRGSCHENSNGKNHTAVNYVHPWDIHETIDELHIRKYYPRASKRTNNNNNGGMDKVVDSMAMLRWPPVLRAIIEGKADLALSSFGACLYYLQRSLIDREILSMGIVKAYIPPESSCASSNKISNSNTVPAVVTALSSSSLSDENHASVRNVTQVLQSAQDWQQEDSGPGHSYMDTNGDVCLTEASPQNSVHETKSNAINDEREVTYMSLDGTTLYNLEILSNSVDHKVAGSLWSKLNHTKTPHGSRLLRAWLLRPLFRKADIDRRLDAVSELISGGAAVSLGEARAVLSKCGDIERLLSRVHSMGAGAGLAASDADDDDTNNNIDMDRLHPNERAVLYETVTYTRRKVGDFSKALKGLRCASQIPEIFEGVDIQSGMLRKIVRFSGDGGCFPDMVNELDWFFANFDCDLAAKGLFEPSKGIDDLFDRATEKIDDIKTQLEEYKKEMCSRHLKAQAKSAWKYVNTNPDSKDKYTIELPASIPVPADFLMKGKRGTGPKQINKYRTAVIDDLVQELEGALDVLKERKAKGMQLIFAKFDSKRTLWAAAAHATAMLDALGSLAQTASKTGYTRPTILDCDENDENPPAIRILQGRHPCVENSVCSEFIPNDLHLGSKSEHGQDMPRVLLLSGPNMGGKSTLLRQTCLIAILSQLGSYVPAAHCEITPIDRIFTRLGASDRILLGQSTFFVELAETAAALRGATRRSLVIMDELGRGTSTFDGTAIASAAVQHLVERSKCLSLFATHYHSLLAEWNNDPRVRLGHMECLVDGRVGTNDTDPDDEDADETKITFLYTLGDGICPKSFGINVARLAGLPSEVLAKAKRISVEFELEISSLEVSSSLATNNQLMTPLDAAVMKDQITSSILKGDWDAVQHFWNQIPEC